jgi:3-phosphoshikimate 1-carboxyvinyltransferase
MTIEAMKKSGVEVAYSESLNKYYIPNGKYSSQINKVEGDWSSASYMLVAGALSGKVIVDNLDINSYQADKEIMRILKDMRAYIKINENRVTTEKSELVALDVNLSDCPDLFPTVACLCSVAKGTSRITGLGRLKHKESDRLTAMKYGLKKMGIKITGHNEYVSITGGKPKGAVIDPQNDHRIAMSFAILANAAEGETTIMNPECVSKSYPKFWEELKQIGAEMR